MFWTVEYLLCLIKSWALEFILFFTVDHITKVPLREATNDDDKRTIWLYESGILLALCTIIHCADHTPYILLLLASITCVYPQLSGRVDVRQWWLSWRTWWEEYQQHEESMRQLQAQHMKQQASAPVPATTHVTPALGVFPPPLPAQGPSGYARTLNSRTYPPNVTLLPGQNAAAPGTSSESPGLIQKNVPGGSSLCSRTSVTALSHTGVSSSPRETHSDVSFSKGHMDSSSGLIQKVVSGGSVLCSGTNISAPSYARVQVPISSPGVMHSNISLPKGQPKVFQGAVQVQRGNSVLTSFSQLGGELKRRPLHQASGFMVRPSLGLASGRPSALKTDFRNTGFGNVSETLPVPVAVTVPPGLKNGGQNLCFINAVLQCLARSPYLAQCLTVDAAKELECSVSESLFLSRLAELLDLLTAKPDSQDAIVLDTSAFRHAASALHGSLVSPVGQLEQQQDAAEFLMWLLDTVHGILNKNRQALSCGADTESGEDRVSDAQLMKLKKIYGDLTPSAAKNLKEACLREIEVANGLENDSYAEAIQRMSDLEWLSYKKMNESIVDTLFTGQLVEASLCLSNNRISVALQTFNLLPVPLASPCDLSGLVLLEDCFTAFCHIEHLVSPGPAASWSACPAQQQVLGSGVAGSSAATPQMMSKICRNVHLSEADSACQSSFNQVSSAVSPIAGQPEFVNDSGFCDNVFKTSTPIKESVKSKTVPHVGDVQRRCLLRQLPECLVVQLKRFSFNTQLGSPTKLHAPVSVRLKGLDLHSLLYDTVTQREDLTSLGGATGSQTYDLYGLCLHLGGQSTSHGHYVCYCLCGDNQWYHFDDEKVTRVNIEYELTTPFVRQNAYLLFYKCAVS